MKKIKLLSIFLVSGICLFPSTIAKADTRPNASETDLLRLINTYSDKEVVLEDGIVLLSGEKLDLPKEDGFKIDNSKVLDIEDGQIVAKNNGSTFVTQEINNKVYILEVCVTENNVSMMTRNATAKKTVDRNYYKVFIDPGHGGVDNGAVQNGFLEDEINLKISKKIEKILSDKGIEVKMSRYNDTYLSLTERTAMSNKEGSDLFVSIHQNSASSSSAKGIETFYYQPRLDSKELATDIQQNLISSTNATNRGVKTQNFTVIKTAQMSSSLVECGFISNLEEGRKLNSDSYQNTVANAIANGIIQYLKDNITLQGGETKPDPAPPETVLKQGVVTANSLNVRSGAGSSYSVMGTLTKDAKVDIVGISDNWYRIKYNNQYGYVHSEYIKTIEDSVAPTPPVDDTPATSGTVITYDLNVRDSASYSASVLGTIKVGSSVSIIENLGEWTKIKYNNSTGYVLTKYIEFSKPTKNGTIITYDLNLRDSASYSANVLDTIKVGSSVSIIENLGEWTKIKYNNSTGYVLTKYIEVNEPTKNGTVITYDLNLRDSASYSANVLDTIKVGSTVSVIENLGEWTKIKSNNSTGYVLTKYIKL